VASSRIPTLGVSGPGVAMVTLGSLLVYVGIRDVPFMAASRDLLRGKIDTPRREGDTTTLTDALGQAATSTAEGSAAAGVDAGAALGGGSGGTYNARQLYQVAVGQGLSQQRAIIAVAVALAESGGQSVRNYDPSTGDDSYGPWQINMLGRLGPERRRQLDLSSDAELLDVKTNARAMAMISSRGLNFMPWTTYRNGKYRRHLATAQQAARG
jgi:hypothetical protein